MTPTKKRVVKNAGDEPVKQGYVASIKVLGKVYTAKGESVYAAIENLKTGPVAKGVSLLTLSKDGKSVSKIITHPQTFRLFNASRTMREITLKQVAMRFGL